MSRKPPAPATAMPSIAVRGSVDKPGSEGGLTRHPPNYITGYATGERVMADVIAEMGHLFLGSRLKRLAECFQHDAGAVFAAAGVPVQPPQMALLAAIGRHGPLTVSAAVEALGLSQPAVTRSLNGLSALGLAATERLHRDQRHKTIRLTPAGAALLARCERDLWPRIDRAVAALCAEAGVDALPAVAALETALARASLPTRIGAPDVTIVDYDDAHAEAFFAINAEWIAERFVLEPHDIHVLRNPRATILAPGGRIRLALLDGTVVGTCALIKTGDGCFELTKMGVRAAARGRKIGEALLRDMVATARTMPVERLYLLTNHQQRAAIHLYEKLGWVHDAAVMREFGGTYDRADVAMSFPLRIAEPVAAAL